MITLLLLEALQNSENCVYKKYVVFFAFFLSSLGVAVVTAAADVGGCQDDSDLDEQPTESGHGQKVGQVFDLIIESGHATHNRFSGSSNKRV